jgi:hypothetical protein
MNLLDGLALADNDLAVVTGVKLFALGLCHVLHDLAVVLLAGNVASKGTAVGHQLWVCIGGIEGVGGTVLVAGHILRVDKKIKAKLAVFTNCLFLRVNHIALSHVDKGDLVEDKLASNNGLVFVHHLQTGLLCHNLQVV